MIRTTTITRSNLIDLVERSIERAALSPLSLEEADALRDVARTSTRVLRGDYYNRSLQCGCPAYQAGLTETYLDLDTIKHTFCNTGVGLFVLEFDRATADMSADVLVLDVTEEA